MVSTNVNTQRKIIHIDMDAFYAAVEQRDNPAYQGKPLAVGGSPDKRGVLATASYEARAFGLHSAMSSFRAVQRCPHLILVPPRFEVYRQVSQQIRSIFQEYTDLIEPVSLDEAYLDITENKRGMTSGTRIAEEVRRRIQEETGLTASAGVSYNKFLAKVASDINKPNGLFVIPPERANVFIDQLPIGKFYGIGQKTTPRLQALGISQGSDLKALSPERMKELFGKSAAFYAGLAYGQDDRPVEPTWIRKSVGAETTFEQDLADRSKMLTALQGLSEEVLNWMNRHRTFGYTLTLKVKYSNFQQITRSKTQETPIKTIINMMQLLSMLLTLTQADNRSVRLLGVSVSRLAHPTGALAVIDRLPAEESRQLKLFG